MLMYAYDFFSNFAGVEMAYFPRAIRTVIYRATLSSGITVRGKIASQNEGGRRGVADTDTTQIPLQERAPCPATGMVAGSQPPL